MKTFCLNSKIPFFKFPGKYIDRLEEAKCLSIFITNEQGKKLCNFWTAYYMKKQNLRIWLDHLIAKIIIFLYHEKQLIHTKEDIFWEFINPIQHLVAVE